jgi:GxxExxY protein
MLLGGEALTERIIGCAIEVHQHTGPGLIESVYDACLARELRAAHLDFVRQVALPMRYKGDFIDCAFRIDYIVERQVLVELKSVERLLDIHKAQVITYLRLAEVPVGLLINFNVSVLRQGLRRLVMTRPATPSHAPPDNG